MREPPGALVSSTFTLHYADGSPKLTISGRRGSHLEVVRRDAMGRITSVWYGTADELAAQLRGGRGWERPPAARPSSQ